MPRTLAERPGLLDRTHDGRALIDNGRFAFMLVMAFDLMLIGGLITAYFVLRGGSLTWPPPEVPQMDAGRMWFASLMLVNTSIGLGLMLRFYTSNRPKRMRSALWFALFSSMSSIFFIASEWWSLSNNGLLPTTVFGGIYSLIMGTMVLHIAIGSFYIARIIVRAGRWSSYVRSGNSIPHTTYFFYLMTIVWSAIFALIYS